MCKYCKYESDDRPCCEDCYLNRQSHMVFYMNLYRKCDFLCEGCIEFYYNRRRQEMLGIQKIVSIKEYNATHKPFCDKCELYEWNHTISFKNGDNYLLCNGCVKFFKNMKNKEMAGINMLITAFLRFLTNLSVVYTIYYKHYHGNKLFN